MRPRWRASVLAAAGAATLLAGCGIRVAAEPSPRRRGRTRWSPRRRRPRRPRPRRRLSAVALRRLRRRHAHSRRLDRRLAAGRAAVTAPGPHAVRPRSPPPRAASRPPPRSGARSRRSTSSPPAWSRAAASPARPWPSSPATRPCTTRCFGLRQLGRPDAGGRRHAVPARRGLAGLHDDAAGRARRRGRAALGPAGAPRVAGVPLERPPGPPARPRSATSPRRAAACRRTPAASCAPSATAAPRCCGGCAICVRPPASAPRTRRRTLW